ncbi:MAG: serine hydrolase, partial [Tepidiformaceae bacterium]
MLLNQEDTGLSPERLERITGHLTNNYIEPGKIGGCQVLVSRHGHTAYQRSLGLADIARKKPIED